MEMTFKWMLQLKCNKVIDLMYIRTRLHIYWIGGVYTWNEIHTWKYLYINVFGKIRENLISKYRMSDTVLNDK